MSKVIVFSLLGILLSATCFSEQVTLKKTELARRILNAQGTQQQLAALSPQIYAGVAAYRAKIAPQAFSVLMLAMKRNFEGPQLYVGYEETFVAQLSEAQLEAVAAWFETPLAKKFLEMEVVNTTPKSAAAMNKSLSAPPSKTRVKLIQDLDKTQRITDVYVDITANVNAGIMAGLLAIEHPEGKPEIKHLRRQIAELRVKIRPKLEKDIFVSFLYKFREATDVELGRYTTYMKSQAGHEFTDALFRALNDTLQRAAQNVGVEVARAMQEMKSR